MNRQLLLSLFLLFVNSGCFFIRDKEPKTPETNITTLPTPAVTVTNSNITGKTELAPSADTLSTALTLLRKGKQSPASASATFIEKDGLRLNISAVEQGYLTVLYKGSDGDTQVIFPSKAFYNAKNEVKPNELITIPGKGWFFFDKKKGTETVFIIYSRVQKPDKFTTDANRTITTLEKIRRGKNNPAAFVFDNDNLVRIVELKHE